MKTAQVSLMLAALLTSCLGKSVEIAVPDTATTVSGNYNLSSASFNGRDVTSNYRSGSFNLKRINSTEVKGICQVFSRYPKDSTLFISLSDNFTLRKINNDSVYINKVGLYQKGEVSFLLNDGTFNLIFKR